MSDLDDHIKEQIDKIEWKVQGVYQRFKNKIRRNPYPFIVGSLLLGVLLGRLSA